MSHLTMDHIIPAETNSRTALWLALFAAAFLAVMFVLAYMARHDGAFELQTAPGQALLFIDLTTHKL